MSTKSDQGPVIFPSRLGGQEVLPLGRRRKADHERALALATERSESAMSTKSDQGPSTFPYRSGAQEVMPLGRRRKASVPELGPMTTVQEACQDSRTFVVYSSRILHGADRL